MSIETCAEMQARLDRYLAARDQQAIGGQVIRTRYGDKEVQINPGDAKRIDVLIADVRAAMARANCPGCNGRRGMLRITPSDGNRYW